MKGWSRDKGNALFEWNPNGASCLDCEKSGILEFLATLANPSVFPAKSQMQHFPKYFKAKPPKHWWSLLGSSVPCKLLELNMQELYREEIYSYDAAFLFCLSQLNLIAVMYLHYIKIIRKLQIYLPCINAGQNYIISPNYISFGKKLTIALVCFEALWFLKECLDLNNTSYNISILLLHFCSLNDVLDLKVFSQALQGRETPSKWCA